MVVGDSGSGQPLNGHLSTPTIYSGHGNSHHNGGVMNDYSQSVVSNTHSKMWKGQPLSRKNNPFSTLFGEARVDIGQDPDKTFNEEIRDLPDAYRGSNKVLGQILISQMTATRTFAINEICPYEKASGLRTEITSWSFKDEYMGQVPEQGVPRLIRNNMASREGSVNRKGIGFTNEHGFLETPMGEQCYWMQMEQINRACTDTLCHEIMHKLYNAEEQSSFKAGRGIDADQFEAIVRRNVEMWGSFQKTRGGFELAMSRAKATMMDRCGQEGNIVIVPCGSQLAAYDANLKDLGVLSRQSVKSDKSFWINTNHIVLRESRAYETYADHKEDPAYRDRTIGGYNIMNMMNIKDVDAKKFHLSKMMRIEVWNEKRDGFEYLSPSDVYRYTGAFIGWDEIPENNDFGTGMHMDLSNPFRGHTATDYWGNDDNKAYPNTQNNQNNDLHRFGASSVPHSQSYAEEDDEYGMPNSRLSNNKHRRLTPEEQKHQQLMQEQEQKRQQKVKKLAHPYSGWALRWFAKKGWRSHGDAYQKQGLLRLLAECISDKDRLKDDEYMNLFTSILYPEGSRPQYQETVVISETMPPRTGVPDAPPPTSSDGLEGKGEDVQVTITPPADWYTSLSVAFKGQELGGDLNPVNLAGIVDLIGRSMANYAGDDYTKAKFEAIMKHIKNNGTAEVKTTYRLLVTLFALKNGDDTTAFVRNLINYDNKQPNPPSTTTLTSSVLFEFSRHRLYNNSGIPRIVDSASLASLMVKKRVLQYYSPLDADQLQHFKEITELSEKAVKADADFAKLFSMCISYLANYIRLTTDPATPNDTSIDAVGKILSSDLLKGPRLNIKETATFNFGADATLINNIIQYANTKDTKWSNLTFETIAEKRGNTSKLNTGGGANASLAALVSDKYKLHLSQEHQQIVTTNYNTICKQYKAEYKKRQISNRQPISVSHKELVVYLLSSCYNTKLDIPIVPMASMSLVRLLENAYLQEPLKEEALVYVLQAVVNGILAGKNASVKSTSASSIFEIALEVADFKELEIDPTSGAQSSKVVQAIGLLRLAEKELEASLHETIQRNLDFVKSLTSSSESNILGGFSVEKDGRQTYTSPLSKVISALKEGKRLPTEELCQVLIDQTSFQKGFGFFKWVVNNNLPVCFGILSFRPNQVWDMGSLCLTFGGGEVGNMLFMLPDFQIENDSVRKVMIANFTVYAGALIRDPRKIVIIPDVFCRGYKGGWATAPWDASNPKHQAEQARDPTKRDYYHCIVEATFKPEEKWIFLNGKGPDQLNGASKSTELSYSTAEYYSTEVWANWEQSDANLVSQINSAQNNTMCFQDYQASYNMLNPERALIVHNKGPWQERLYEGSANARSSGTVFLKPVNTQRISLMSIGA